MQTGFRLVLHTALLAASLWCTAPTRAANLQIAFVDDSSGSFAQRGWMDGNSLFQRNVRAAGALWGAMIHSDTTLIVQIVSSPTVPLWNDAPVIGSNVGTVNGFFLQRGAALDRVLGVANKVQVDVVVHVGAAGTDQYYALDSAPETRGGVIPFFKSDVLSIALHEMGHGLGIFHSRSVAAANYGALQASGTVFDLLSVYSGDGTPTIGNALLFTGPLSMLVNGGNPTKIPFVPPVDRTVSQNFSHIGDCYDADVRMRQALMNGCSPPEGGTWLGRYKVTAVDYAVLSDIGFPMRSIYFPDSGELIASYPANGKLTAARYVRVAGSTTDFTLAGTGVSNQPSSDATYDPVADALSMSNLVLNDTPSTYKATLTVVPGTAPKRYRLQGIPGLAP